MKTVIVFYTRDGSSRVVADVLKESMPGAETIELIETRSRAGLFGFLRSGFEASRGKSSELSGTPWTEVSEYDELYLVSPVWASKPAPALRTFLSHAALSGKTVHTVTVQADAGFNGAEHTHAVFQDLAKAAGGKPGRSLNIHGAKIGKLADRVHIEEQVRRL